MGVTSGHVPVLGATLYYEATGEGRPLVLLHAGLSDLRMWDDQVGALARRHRVIRYDLRGYGRSPATDHETPHREDLYELLGFLKIDAASLCGLSLGGYTAIDFALDHPDMVHALIPVSSGFSGYQPVHTRPQAEEVLFAEAEAARERGEFDRLVDVAVRIWVDGPGQSPNRVPQALRERVRAMFAANLPTDEKRRRLPARPPDPPAAARLSEIRAPTLVVVGDLDTSAIRSATDIMAERIPGARKLVLTGCAHLLNMERPEEFNRIVKEFLHDVERPHDHP